MWTYVAATYPGGYDFPISTLFWRAVIVVALFVSCLLAWKAIGWVRNRGKSGGVVVEVHLKDPEEPRDPWENAISRPPADYYGFSGYYGDELGGLGSMTQREQEELFSTYAPRKVRKAMKQRRKAREQAQKNRTSSHGL